MNTFKFSTKLCKDEFAMKETENRFNFNLDKPLYCPICHLPQAGELTGNRKLWQFDNTRYYGTVMYRCTNCGKYYLVTYDIDTDKRTGDFGAFYPTLSVSYENETLQSISPSFINVYNQALTSEYAGNVELAAIGYRKAVEVLIKDFAIKFLKKPEEEVISKTLYSAISEYCQDDFTIKSADVVRILGNDYTHYERKYPEMDFQILKSYLNMFTELIERKIKLSSPPVSR